MQTTPKTRRINFAVRVLAVILCLVIGLSGVVIPAKAQCSDTIFTGIAAALATQGIASNIGTVTCSSPTITGLYFEKRTTVGDPATAIGKMEFTTSLDFMDPTTQTFMYSLHDQIDINTGHIALDVSTSAGFQEHPAILVMYNLPIPVTEEQLVVRDDAGNIIFDPDLVGTFSQDPVTGDVTFDVAHFTQFDIDTTKPTVATFTVTTPSASLNIPITTFTASDNIKVAGYLITRSSTPPASGDPGWAVTKPTTYTVASDGSYKLYPWAKDAAGNVSAVFGSPRVVVVDTTPALTFRSTGSQDGWVLESSETSSKGGSLNPNGPSIYLGDDASNRQYRAILSFNTESLPANATITKVTLMIKYQGMVGTNPFTTHGNILVDIKKGFFSTSSSLQIGDFQASPSKSATGTITNTPASGWYMVSFGSSTFTYINKAGLTQFRLRFSTDDNNDHGADYLKFFSGDYSVTGSRPKLIIEYH